jgi:hypothetical protein
MNFNDQLAEGFQVIDHLQQQALYLEENDMVQCSFNITDGAQATPGKYYEAAKEAGAESDEAEGEAEADGETEGEVKKKGRKRRQRRRKKKNKEEETEEDIYCEEGYQQPH